jgi:hypothetical protein
MKFQGAVVKEQGVTFAIVAVKPHVIDNRSEARRTILFFQPAFSGVPIILMAQDVSGRARYCGRRDIIQFLATVPLMAIPWKEYMVG